MKKRPFFYFICAIINTIKEVISIEKIGAIFKNIKEKFKLDNNTEFETRHIKELDGLRALFILIVFSYHTWQQSWLSPSIGNFSLDFLVRNGSIIVDALILLSGFCLFLPYARSKVYNEPIPNTKKFYINRVARIVPSYLFAMIVILVFFVFPRGGYSTFADGFKDIFTHLLFIHNLFPDIIVNTKILGVLWTVAVEMQLYLVFPFLAKAFLKKPIVTYLTMTVIGLIGCFIISNQIQSNGFSVFSNHTITFLPVFANGMLGAYIYMKISNKYNRKNKVLAIISTILMIVLIACFEKICSFRMSYSNEVKWQVDFRYLLSFYYLAIILSTIFAFRCFRFFFNNRIMRFLAAISYNLYIYHQFIGTELKANKIPYWAGEELPNIAGNEKWKVEYTLVVIAVSLIVGVITTYLIEKPANKLIKKSNFYKNIQ